MTNFNFFTTSLKSTLSKQITTLLLVFILIFGFCTGGPRNARVRIAAARIRLNW